jgi:mono/diheme cytochrome c family protein
LFGGWHGHGERASFQKKYDAAAVRSISIITAAVAATLLLGACGSQGIEVDSEADEAGAQLFAQRCAGCHTLEAAGTLGSSTRVVRNQGPNLDERAESPEDVLYAIQNGGFSGAIMPQQIVTGEDAEAVADFVAKYSGTKIDRPTRPSAEGGSDSVTEGDAAEDPATGDAINE